MPVAPLRTPAAAAAGRVSDAVVVTQWGGPSRKPLHGLSPPYTLSSVGTTVRPARQSRTLVYSFLLLITAAALALVPPGRPASALFDGPTLLAGQRLGPGEALGGLTYRTLVMQTDGNLVVYDRETSAVTPAAPAPRLTYPTWSSGTAGQPGAFAVLQTDGNLVVYSAGGRALWWSGTSGRDTALVMQQSDGNLVLYGAAGALWSTGAMYGPDRLHGPGSVQALRSASHRYRLYGRGLGLSLMDDASDPPGHLYWILDCYSQTGGQFCGVLVLQSDGNLVQYPEHGGPAVWSSRTAGAGPDVTLLMQDDGNLVLYGARGALWWTGTTFGKR